MNQFYKNLALWLVIGIILIALFNIFNQPITPQSEIVFSEFMNKVENGEVAEVVMQGDHITGKYTDGQTFQTYAPSKDPDLIKSLRDKDVRMVVKPPEQTSWYMNVLISWFPMILLLGIWIFFMRQMQSGGGKALSFGKSKARLMNEGKTKTTFKDVSGCDEAKEELHEIIEFLKEPQKFSKLGGKIPKGVLLVGPPGTGKTLLARAIAGEANVPFFSISGSDFVEMFVGVGASRVRDLFEQGKKNSPCIIFIDEIDAVGRHRGAGLGGGHDEREQTLNQLLVEMDGFENNEGVILIAATNRPDVLDPALLRPGRFDRQVVVGRPDIKGREGILKVHTAKVPLSDNVNLKVVARGTPGFTGADLANLVNEAALLAARDEKKVVTMEDFENAKDKVMMGVERRSMVITEKEKKTTAYHEAGHALVAFLLPGTDPLHKVTIIPRGRALGVTMQLPEDEKHTYPKEYLIHRLAIMMGGRVAEEVCLGEITTGAGNDIEVATETARKMVCEWGMSEKMGPLTYGTKEEQVFLGKDFSAQKNFSDETAKLIDLEVKALVMGGYNRAKELLTENRDALERLAVALLEQETLDLDEIKAIIKNRPLDPDSDSGKTEPAAGLKAEDTQKGKKSKGLDEGLVGGGGVPDPTPA
ncbi:Cell division protease FtsH [Nitrospina gracilis 3/211]|uniref:ATP-dependent zinc metalloprotease FtsH n=1 Tax=Nitrospina gracilis (strain 3/211) TaxID=1266370 RepID=M1YLV5_NITG3|nr:MULTISPECIES: ATP-dependent zinc metalloprotease FtsH [Nitrospina]MCF8724312.1 cell division protease FtsH [Nitrospina sp. Nb-3]CCQ91465.1 Cell division protease FtsH [Nitrospina gracilis 3/211]